MLRGEFHVVFFLVHEVCVSVMYWHYTDNVDSRC